MQIPTEPELLDRIRRFLDETGMKPTRFGREAVGEASFIASLDGGRSPSLKITRKLVAFMDGYRPDHSAADTVDDDEGESGNEGKVSAALRAA